MDFDIPEDIAAYLKELDEFIETTIRPLEQKDDNIRFFDHRREYERTDWEKEGIPKEEWEALLAEAKRLAMAIIRDHLTAKGLGLHNDLQNEHSIVGNTVGALLMLAYGNEAQKEEFLEGLIKGDPAKSFAFGITEPDHGSDATHMETSAERQGRRWIRYYRFPCADGCKGFKNRRVPMDF